MAKRESKFKFVAFSKKQKQVLTWWIDGLPKSSKDIIVADGAVRAGKTVIMSMSYVIWAMSNFNYCKFGMAGKTIGSFRRNVLFSLKIILKARGFKVIEHRTDNYLEIKKGKIVNYFHIFGGKDERSQDIVQGFTSAGFFFDEVALMPESFVNQAIARCSEEGRKIWFNCNPDGPFHWFKVEWLDKLDEKNGFEIHFLLDDNPSLSEKTKEFYRRNFRGVFYDRFILGLWVAAEGVIYSMFNKKMIIDAIPKMVRILKKWIGVDYGQSNATVFILIGLGSDNNLYILDEYYHEGRKAQVQKSPSKYAKDFKKWLIANGVEGMPVRYEDIFIDPSAKGFMLQLHEEGVNGIKEANNEVLKGIELMSSILDCNILRILKRCKNTIIEFSAYRWDPKAQEKGEDKPIKENDHAMDAIRYVINGTRLTWQRHIARLANAV